MSLLERNESWFPHRHAVMYVFVSRFVYALCISLRQVQYVARYIQYVAEWEDDVLRA